MDIELGSKYNDGGGATQLLSEMKTDERTFLPHNADVVNKRLYALSLENSDWGTQRIAHVVAAVLADELIDRDAYHVSNSNRFSGAIGKVLSKTPPFLQNLFYTANTMGTVEQLFKE